MITIDWLSAIHWRRIAQSGFYGMILALTACQESSTEAQERKKPLPVVTVHQAQAKTVSLTQESVGTLESIIDPTIAAEIAGRVMQVLVHPGQRVKQGQVIAILDATDVRLQLQEADTEVARIEALIRNQQKMVERNQALVDKNFISKNALDDTTTQLDALKQQLSGAKSRVAAITHNGSKHRVLAPTDGVIETQIVSNGDFVKIGDPVVKLINNSRLRAHLPFPESIAKTLKPGLPLVLTTPTASNTVNTVIRDIQPQIDINSRAVDVTADIVGQADWQPGASVTGKVITGERDRTVLVPEQSVVLRPAGEVVYTLTQANGEARTRQRVVKTGISSDGQIEILQGLQAGEWVVVDGAGFLTDDTQVQIQESQTNTKTEHTPS